ncbi:FAD-binding and (Fe-S)-binding domain-containing protein [Nocardia pseudobrasiliensis]|uniref:FAD/FMN-containing dehydrogenase n=1 Tax=Nocardia pseudobrasiliensis TaxID=45979 RepID=A0A370HX27_9NOCA|nr:FAD-binding and (Fe-S)-binding domain-containing protein [Nocardia pseudobrasiliensis]RDI63015.1 FAD/FMN-containing dehydrogenase [Nocardia pseudobrasiliensis]
MTDSWVRGLRAAIDGEVDTDERRRAEYSSDASNYRVRPAAVVFPRGTADIAAALEWARAAGLPVTARGAGTSVAGNAIGPGLVLDFSRHLNEVLEIDPEKRCARVQPGVVLSQLQQAAAPHGLRFGPDPSTQNRCTLGGMIGNNACGPRAVAWGRTSDTVRELRILDGVGSERVLGAGLTSVPGLSEFTQRNLALIRTDLGRFDRQASGYGLEHLLPERGSSAARALVGAEGTCGLLLEATVDLVPLPAATLLVVLGYPDMPTAADDIAAVMARSPTAVEGIDARLVDVVRAHGRAVPELPTGGGWLFVELAADSAELAHERAELLCRGVNALDSRIVADPAAAARLWRIRADGAGLAGRTPDGKPAWPGWEDAAVPPEKLGPYLRDFDELMRAHRVDGLLYGHIGDGCIHVRLDLPIADAPRRFREFLTDAADLVVRHGGSLSGEHGDGRARSELLARMYSPRALAAFAEFKGLFDPDDVLNPGVLVRPRPLDADLRLVGVPPTRPAGGFAYPADGDIATAVHRCVGIGKCRADTRATGGFMCPSYLATADEKDSTRGRARVLQEAVRGALDWRSPAVSESLDLCLSCKACASDCPAGVDMATYKSETLYRRYRHRPRPRDHYALGQLPRWLAAATRIPRLANALAASGALRRLGLRAAGVDPRRQVPTLADKSFRAHWRARRHTPRPDSPGGTAALGSVGATRPNSAAESSPASGGARPAVMLWIDTFTDAFDPDIAWAAAELIESLGYAVSIPERRVCCGLTWISTGQLDGARKRLRATLSALEEHIAAGGVVVGLEPSCTAVLRSDLLELLPEDPRAPRTARAVRTLAEFLEADPTWRPPDLSGRTVLVQPHCHQHAVLGFEADLRILRQTGAKVTEVTGCCGLAGNFGMQAGHYEISVAVAENGLLPALRAAGDDTTFLADGFSCRTQAAQLGNRAGGHLAQLLLGR